MAFDFDAVTAPFRMQPGLRRVAEGLPLLTPSAPGSPHLRAKCEVLRQHAADALLSLPGFDAAPVFETLAAAAAPGLRVEPGGGLLAPRLRWAVRGDRVEGDGPAPVGDCLRALPPALRPAGLASLAFTEDLAVVDGASTRVPWLAVCLPSHWAPAEKIGLPLAAIHAPVADSGTLVAASDALVRIVTAGERWERFVWTLTPREALDAHPARLCAADWPAVATPASVAAAAFFRTEHQRFQPLRGGGRSALFAISVEVVPLARAVDRPERARRLHDALVSMSDAVLDYRGLRTVRGPLLAWLAAHGR